MPIKILLVDDHTIIRASLRSLLERQPDVVVLDDTGDGKEAVDLARRLCPDIVLMDVTLRGSEITGIEATRRITEVNPDARVIGLSVSVELTYIKRMLAAGARGYLCKGCSETELVDAIHAVQDGASYFSENARRAVQEDYVNLIQSPEQNNTAKLTTRELQVLERVAAGRPSKHIAADLDISRKTVDAHRYKIMKKLKIWSVAELTRYALREGIVVEGE